MKTRIFSALTLLVLLTTLLFSGCRKSTPVTTLFVSIEQMNYTLGSRGTTITLQATSAPTPDHAFPYHLSGEAVRGTEYEVKE